MDYNDDVYRQTLAFWHVCEKPWIAARFRPEYFSVPGLQKAFAAVKDYIVKYGEPPCDAELFRYVVETDGRYVGELTLPIIKGLYETRAAKSQYSSEWLEDYTICMAKYFNFRSGVENLNSYLMTYGGEVTPETVDQFVQRASVIFQDGTYFDLDKDDSGCHDFFDPREHLSVAVERRTTGYRFMDACLCGGWARKTFNVLMGSPKAGKSMWLCNLAANSVRNGDDCAYITLEMSHQLVNQRIGSNLFNVRIQDYERLSQEPGFMEARIKGFHRSCPSRAGALLVKEFPTSSATALDIELALREEERRRSTPDVPFKFRNVFIDYVNIMADGRDSRKGSDNTYVKIKNICEDVRAMAQRNDWCVVSVTQTNRGGMDSTDPDMANVSESAGLVATADSMFAIISTPAMKAQGTYYLKALALRNSPHMGDRKEFTFSNDFLRIGETDRPPTAEINAPGTPERRDRKGGYTRQDIQKLVDEARGVSPVPPSDSFDFL